MVARFNHTHTVGDVRRYINACVVPFSLTARPCSR